MSNLTDGAAPVMGETEEAEMPPGGASLDESKARTGQLDRLPRIWTFKELYDAEIPRPAGIINGRIYCPGSVGILAGPAGIGKTWLSKLITGAVSLGRNIGPLRTTASNALFLSEEMDEAEIHDRILQLFTPEEAEAIFDRVRFVCQSGVRLDTDTGLTRLRRIMEKSGSPPLTMIDALSDVKGVAKENDNDQMGAILRGLRGVARDVGTAPQAVHHYGKPSEFKKGADLVRGASAIRDVCADIVTVSKSKKGRLVDFAKVRHGAEPEPFTFDLQGDGAAGPVRLVFGEADAGTGFEEAGYVIRTVREEGGRLDRQTALGILQRKKGWSENTAQKYIDEALTSDLLRKDKSGRSVFYETA